MLSRAGGAAVAQVIDLLRAQGTARVDGLDGAPLLVERRLNGRGWGFVDQRARLVGGAWSRPLELGRNRLRACGYRLRGTGAGRFRLLDRPGRYGLSSRCRAPHHGLRGCGWTCGVRFRGWPVVDWNLCRGGWVRDGRRSDDLRLALLREAGAVYRLRSRELGLAGLVNGCRLADGPVDCGGRLGGADWRSRRASALEALSGFNHRAGLHRRYGAGWDLRGDDRGCRSDQRVWDDGSGVELGTKL